MEFSKAQFESLVAEFDAGMDHFSLKLNGLVEAVNTAANRWYVNPAAGKTILIIGQKAINALTELRQLIEDFKEGIFAPVLMFVDAWDWMQVKGAASGASSALSTHHLVVDDSDWSGKARDAYVNSTAAHSAAAAKISSIANNTATQLGMCALAGLAFYSLLITVLAKLAIATVVAIDAFASVVFSWAGVVLIFEEAAVNTLLISAGLGSLLAFLGAQANTMIALKGEAVDNSAFPGGKWPSPNTKTFNDATVTDGDADWSLAGN